MGIVDDLRAGIAAAEGAIAGLGPRPQGNPGAMLALAHQVRAQADRAAAAGRLESRVMPSLVFEGPGAKRFAGNADEVAESLFVSQRMLDDAADAIIHEARRIERAQHEHERSNKRLRGQIEDLVHQVSRAVR
jgi:uncharacterized protein YukE